MSRILVSIALLLLFTACAIPESEQLRKENTDLKAQLETVTQERDGLKLQIDSIRKALEAPAVGSDSGAPVAPESSTPVTPESGMPDSGMPDSGNPDSGMPDSGTPGFGTRDSNPNLPEVAPVNPGSSSEFGVAPASPEKTPETAIPERSTPPKVLPEQPLAPQSTAPVAPNSETGGAMGGAAITTSPLYQYANQVAQAATNYRVQTQQAPPPDCSLGYSAGQNKVERSTQVKRCEVQALENNQFRVRLESIDGSVVIAP